MVLPIDEGAPKTYNCASKPPFNALFKLGKPLEINGAWDFLRASRKF